MLATTSDGIYSGRGQLDDKRTLKAARPSPTTASDVAIGEASAIPGSVGTTPPAAAWLASALATLPVPPAPPSLRRPALPAHNPYEACWLGAAPTGRWVLDRGRPRCVDSAPRPPPAREWPQPPQPTNIGPSLGQVATGVVPPVALLPCHPLPQGGSCDARNAETIAAAETPAAAAAPMTAAAHLATHLAAALSRCPSVTSESTSTSGDVATTAWDCSTNVPWVGSASVVLGGSANCSYYGGACDSTTRSRRELEGFMDDETVEEVEDVHDILQDLAQPANTLLTRFPWVQARPVSVTAMAPSIAMRSSRSGSTRALTRSSTRVRPRSRAPTCLTSEGNSSSRTFAKTPQHRAPVMGSQARKVDRDLRWEVKRLKDELFGSVRNAFEGSDAWDHYGGELDFLHSDEVRQRAAAFQLLQVLPRPS